MHLRRCHNEECLPSRKVPEVWRNCACNGLAYLGSLSIKYHSPSPTYKECLLSCFVAMYCPCSSSVCCTAVNRTLVNKYMLLGFICSMCAANSACFSALRSMATQVSWGYVSTNINVNESHAYLFHCIPSTSEPMPDR